MCVDRVNSQLDMFHSTTVCDRRQLYHRVERDLQIRQLIWNKMLNVTNFNYEYILYSGEVRTCNSLSYSYLTSNEELKTYFFIFVCVLWIVYYTM